MTMLTHWFVRAFLALGAAAAFAQAAPDVPPQHRAPTPIIDTPGPRGSFGCWGPDIFRGQAVAQRFTVPSANDFRLARVGIFLMNNSDTEHRPLKVYVQTDALDEGGIDTMPSGHVLEAWQTNVETLGWVPQEQSMISAKTPRLHAGRNYWVVAASRAPALQDPVWVYAKRGNEVTSQTSGGIWYPGAETAALTLRVDAVPIAH